MWKQETLMPHNVFVCRWVWDFKLKQYKTSVMFAAWWLLKRVDTYTDSSRLHDFSAFHWKLIEKFRKSATINPTLIVGGWQKPKHPELAVTDRKSALRTINTSQYVQWPAWKSVLSRVSGYLCCAEIWACLHSSQPVFLSLETELRSAL